LDILSLAPALELLPPEDPETNLEACCTTSRHRYLVDLAGGHLTMKGTPNRAYGRMNLNYIGIQTKWTAVEVEKYGDTNWYTACYYVEPAQANRQHQAVRKIQDRDRKRKR